MMDMIEGTLKYLAEGDWPAVVLIAVVFILTFGRPAYTLISDIKERKNNDLKGALEIDGLSDDVRFVIQESLNRTYFYRATGIASDPYIRSKVRAFLENTRGDITLFGIKRVSEYIDTEGGRLSIKFSRFDIFYFFWKIITGIVLFIVSLSGYAVLAATWREEGDGKLLLAVISTLGICLTLYSVWHVFSFLIAKEKIKPAFERFENTSSESVSEDQDSEITPVSIKTVG